MKLTGYAPLLMLVLAFHAPLGHAQEYVVAVAEENFRARPNGAKLGTLKQGAELAALHEEGRWVKASLRGWIWKNSVRPGRERSTVLVNVASENLRAIPAPGGQLLGTVLWDTPLKKRSERGGWVLVSYDGWIWEPSLASSTERSGAGKPDVRQRTRAPSANAEGGAATAEHGAEAGPADASRDRSAGPTRAGAAEGDEGAPALTLERTVAVPEENLRGAPRGRQLGRLRRGADLAVLDSRGDWLKVATRGYFYAASASGSGSSRKVARPSENLRIAPGSEIVGVLRRDAPLRVLGRAGGWLEVEIQGWLWKPSTLALRAAGTATESAAGSKTGAATAVAVAEATPAADGAGEAPGEAAGVPSDRAAERTAPNAGAGEADAEAAGRPAAAATDAAAAGEAAPLPARMLARSVPLKDGPEGALIGQALTGAPVIPIRTAGDWVKVRFEGWMPRDALAASTAPVGPVTIPMVIADPDAYRGAEATWRLELITLERSDSTRSDFPAGEPYLLTRNAGGEREYVYLAIPERMVQTFQQMPAFTQFTVRGVVRTGRSALVGNPILEFRELVEQRG